MGFRWKQSLRAPAVTPPVDAADLPGALQGLFVPRRCCAGTPARHGPLLKRVADALGGFEAEGALKYWNLSGGLGRLESAAGGARPVRYYFSDHLGSLRAVATSAGTVMEARDYYAFGLEMPGRTFTPSLKTREGYTGHQLDAETGFNYAGARYYNPGLARWMVVDPLAHKYPGHSPYNYVLNNPMRFIDPDGREVRCRTEQDCQRAAEDIQELYFGAPVGVEQRTRTRARFSIFGFGFGGTVTEKFYTVIVDGQSDFDWSQDDYASALYDALASESVIFNVAYQETGPVGNQRNVDLQRAGGGIFSPISSREANIYIDPRGYQRVGDPSSIILMHEMIGHGHPVATPLGGRNNAHDINRFYQRKLGITPRAGYRTPHQGYKGEIVWPRIGIYRR